MVIWTRADLKANQLLQVAIILGYFCVRTSVGKIPPTLPACSEEEETKVALCQQQLNASLVSRLPSSRMFFTGHTQPTELIQACQIINHYSACDTNSLGFCRRVRSTPPPTDYFFMSLSNFCYNGAFNDYPTLFLCYQSASRLTTKCYTDFRNSTRSSDLHSGSGSRQQQLHSREAHCRLYNGLIDCVSKEIEKFCGTDAVKLVEPLLEISIPTSAYCTANKFLRYIMSMQADQYVGSDSTQKSELVPGSENDTAGSTGKSISPNVVFLSMLTAHVIRMLSYSSV